MPGFRDRPCGVLQHALTADFTLVDSHGTVTNREQNLAEVAAREPFCEMFRNHDQQLRLYGDTALIVGVTSVRGRAGGEAFATGFRYTATWMRQGGEWRLAASHASRLPWRSQSGISGSTSLPSDTSDSCQPT